MSPQVNFPEPPLIGDPVLDRYLLELHNRVFGHGPDTQGDLDEENIDLTNINHAANHQDDGIDEINVAGLSGQLADLQLPVDHSHQSSGSGVGGKIDHVLALTSVGTNTHAAIDTHIADDTLHFLEGSIDHSEIDELAWSVAGHTMDATLDMAGFDIDNVGDIAVDTISSVDGTSLSVLLGTDAGDDFIVGNNNAFVVEGDNDFVGIGTNAPDYQLHQVPLGEAKIAAVSNTNLLFQSNQPYVAEFVTNDPGFAGFLVRSHNATGHPYVQLYNTITEDIWTILMERGQDRLKFIHGHGGSNDFSLTLTSDSNNLYIGVNETLPDAQLEIVTYSATDPGLKVKGSVSQSADLIRATDSSDNIGFKVEADFDVVIGSGAAGKDYSLTFNGETTDGVMTWMEDEDHWQFDDDIYLNNGEFLIFDKASGHGIKVDGAAPTFGWRDLRAEIRTRGVGGTDPNDTTYIGNVKAYSFSVNDEAWIEFHIPHDYVTGTDIHLHFHWSHNSAIVTGGSITIGADVTYAKGHDQAAFLATVNPTFSPNASTTQYQHLVSEIQLSATSPSAVQIDTDDLEPDGLILARVYLSANNITSGGAIPDPFIHEVDVHYQSTNIATKNKVPDFYT